CRITQLEAAIKKHLAESVVVRLFPRFLAFLGFITMHYSPSKEASEVLGNRPLNSSTTLPKTFRKRNLQPHLHLSHSMHPGPATSQDSVGAPLPPAVTALLVRVPGFLPVPTPFSAYGGPGRTARCSCRWTLNGIPLAVRVNCLSQIAYGFLHSGLRLVPGDYYWI
ncbi:hypothetical protein SISSUDRAFT_1094581, partial [Sistotremastrum suecicum HHB10207 ss-3]